MSFKIFFFNVKLLQINMENTSTNEQSEDNMNVEEDTTNQPKDSNEDEIDNETDDNSQEEETHQFLSLISKAERKNQRRIARKEKINLNNKSSWREVHLDEPDEESTDTDDEDDPNETRKFLSMMKQGSDKPKNLVKIRWVSGKVAITPVGEGEGDLTITRLPTGQAQETRRQALPDTVTVTRVPAQEDAVRRHQMEIERRREVARSRKTEESTRSQQKGKRKFEDRMTLTEAKIGDFEDSRDYVDFLQSKLQGINIKIVK